MKEKNEYKEKLRRMTDDLLFEETKNYIWLSAYASNNPKSKYHWMCDFTYDEAQQRGKPEIYSNAHKYVMKSEGYG